MLQCYKLGRAAELLDTSEGVLWNEIEAHRLPAFEIDGVTTISEAELQTWLKRHRLKPEKYQIQDMLYRLGDIIDETKEATF